MDKFCRFGSNPIVSWPQIKSGAIKRTLRNDICRDFDKKLEPLPAPGR